MDKPITGWLLLTILPFPDGQAVWRIFKQAETKEQCEVMRSFHSGSPIFRRNGVVLVCVPDADWPPPPQSRN